MQATDARWAEVSQEQSRDVMERYASYLTPEEQYVLFSLKPGTREYDQLLASAIAREASNQPAHLGTLLNREIGLLRETDWDGALFGPLAPGMSLTDRNRIEMALLGPIFGMPSATLTAFGVDPQTVAMTNQLGMLGWDIAGSGFVLRPKSTRGMGKVDGGSTKVVQTESLPQTSRKPGLEGLGPNALDFSGGPPNALSDSGSIGKPSYLQRIKEGNDFNLSQASKYPHNEVYIERPDGSGRYTRLDSYNPNSGDIVSRKYTQLSNINEATAIKYINEAVSKYPAGAVIANVPSSGTLAGKRLVGDLILEIPPQLKPIPKSILDHAARRNVIIRDSNGRVY